MELSTLRAVLASILPLSRDGDPISRLRQDTSFGAVPALTQRRQRPTDDVSPLLRAGVLAEPEGWAVLEIEVRRARRNHRPLSIVLLEADPVRFGTRRGEQARGDAQLVDIGHLLTHLVRITDSIAISPERNRFMLLLPETDLSGARTCSGRVQADVAREVGIRPAWGAAQFPSSALTATELVRQAEGALASGDRQTIPFTLTEVGDADAAQV